MWLIISTVLLKLKLMTTHIRQQTEVTGSHVQCKAVISLQQCKTKTLSL